MTHVPKILGPVDLRSGNQVTKRGTMSGPNFNYLYATVPATVSDRFLSNFQRELSSPSCTYNISSVFYIAELRSMGGHDFVMLSRWGNIEIAPIPKILDICFILSLLCFNAPICNNTRLSFSLLGVLIQAWGQTGLTEVK